MSNIIPFNFNNHKIRIINDVTGQPWFVLSDVCKALNLTNPSAVADRLDDDEKSNPKPDLGLRVDQLLINESGLFSVILRSDKTSAKVFKKWLTSEVLPSIRNNGSYSAHTSIFSAADKMIFEMAINTINPDQASKIAMLKKFGEDRGHSMDYLPEEVDAPPAHDSLTELLRKNHSSISAIRANDILIRLGLIEVRTRLSSNGKQKKYKGVTDNGRRYGLNRVSLKSPNETRVRWYVETFPELLEMITKKYDEADLLAK
ncbi:hypothetical protein A9Q73_03660 [Bermanella sp. 47_1433_sub80_T6]|nr:hypothetical protein A9Q73_03660 [Bermanella sp. 47_1433_sub80_T6]